MIGNDYLTLKHFDNNITTNIKAQICEYSHYSVNFLKDISNMVADYSYDCTCDDNIHMTATLTLHVETDDQNWFMKRENKMREWVDEETKNIWSTSWSNICYHLIKTYTYNDTDKIYEIDLGYFVPTNDDYSYSPTDGTYTINLSGLAILLTKEKGGSIVSYIETTKTFDPDAHEWIETTLPVSLSLEEGLSIDGNLLYQISMGAASQDITFMNYTAPIPLKWGVVGDGQKVWDIPYQIDFDNDIGRADELQEIMDLAFEGGTFWVDEDRVLHMESKPTKRNGVEMFWSDYGELFLSESSEYADDNYYNITEVYGKDNNSYAICDWSHLDGGTTHYARKQVISDDTLQSNTECYARARWECYKARYGHQTWTVSLSDNYVSAFNKPSLIVGKRIEYTTVDGDTNLFFLEKLSYASNKWTMTLSLFRPLYEVEFESYEGKPLPETNRYQEQLKQPYIQRHEIIDNKYIRLFVGGADIQKSIAKIYATDPYGVANASAGFRAESCLVADNGVDKYVDIPIKGNGTYKFDAALYSPLYLDSGLTSQWYTVTIDLPVSERTDTDPYPHPPMYDDKGGHRPYLFDGRRKILTDGNGNRLTT